MSTTRYETILAEMIDFLTRLGKTDVREETRLAKDLDLDSIEVMELVAEFEDHFDIVIPTESLPELQTVGDLAQCLTAVVEEGSPSP
ncbi:acyl carrier protein [Candidatus Entotheonella palauensis]|uniref:acyl carrier protein n=1 Tax=Candidatus Entotheonella palauensis TaxID=93172 RepID=UPI0021189B0D|nr:phosphopantetheine-binding protein [Candidatus Entotheonella palauensis]